MKTNKHTITELKQMQSLPLGLKIKMTQSRIRGWVDEYGEDGVYVSFSGGKDSTVLMDIARKIYPNIVGVFVDTGLEYPEIREFVKRYENIDWIKPKKNFKQVIEEYGYPFISKEVAMKVEGARRYMQALSDDKKREVMPSSWAMADMMGIDKRIDKDNTLYQKLKKGEIPKATLRYEQVVGNITSQYNITKYKFFLDAPFEISDKCCYVMKKSPIHMYDRKTGRKPMTGQMANESRLRTSKWIQNGCNGFDMAQPISNPLSFWTDNDIFEYIRLYDLPLCSVYGDIVLDGDTYKTTGCNRTGCMFCGFGCHLEKNEDSRFLRMKETHPKQYDYIMRPVNEGGLNYKNVIDWINEHGKFNIKY